MMQQNAVLACLDGNGLLWLLVLGQQLHGLVMQQQQLPTQQGGRNHQRVRLVLHWLRYQQPHCLIMQQQ
jgi:hypothetical protein